MPSLSSESGRMSRRGSSDRVASTKRPTLLRASATEPSITTSNASRDALATSLGRRATELLSRVAVISSSPPDSVFRFTCLLSSRTPVFDSVDRQSELSSSPVSQPDTFDDLHAHSFSGRYFSFPSFDMYESSQQDEEKETETKTP
ncbi:hypothetical protein VTK56DRAFT_8971 [Thermocarpiscus australiensis]